MSEHTTTCFNEHKKNSVSCKNKKCRYWHKLKSDNNCIINASQKRIYTLQEVGDLFDITRMRVCQIEKSAINKLKAKSQ
jgi:DNA-directed RNA polymerase sigma subunit (sigma70/sigma32)